MVPGDVPVMALVASVSADEVTAAVVGCDMTGLVSLVGTVTGVVVSEGVIVADVLG